MLPSILILPFRGEAKINHINVNIRKNVHIRLITSYIIWHELSITDKNIVRLQIIVDQATLMDQFKNIQQFQSQMKNACVRKLVASLFKYILKTSPISRHYKITNCILMAILFIIIALIKIFN